MGESTGESSHCVLTLVDPIDARELCALAARDGVELLEKYRLHLTPARCTL